MAKLTTVILRKFGGWYDTCRQLRILAIWERRAGIPLPVCGGDVPADSLLETTSGDALLETTSGDFLTET